MTKFKEPDQRDELKRELGVFQAMMLGLGSIMGTGVFVSIGLGAEIAGNAIILAILSAAMLAMCNGISSAQLAANHPVSGGTYEYGYRWLNPRLGFAAGWMFMFAKSSSAATAALGVSGYVLHLFDTKQIPVTLLAIIAIAVLSLITLTGIRRSSMVNTVIVTLTILTLLLFAITGFLSEVTHQNHSVSGSLTAVFADTTNLFEAIALMFVAYTGYGRIATLGEEVKSPRQTIPKAIIMTLVLSMTLYILVCATALKTVGAGEFGRLANQEVAPLHAISLQFENGLISVLIGVGAITAMVGVLLNLILGLSRVLMAMGRRRDVPAKLAVVHQESAVPRSATIVVALLISLLALMGDVKLTWSFSAFTVLIYYALTNLCAIRLKSDERMYPIWISYLGLAGCLFLSFWIEWTVFGFGAGVLVLGLIWQSVVPGRLPSSKATP